MKRITKFNMSFDVFPRFARQKVNFMERDIDQFIKYGHSLDEANLLDIRIKLFQDLLTDAELEGNIMIATEKKNKLSEAIRDKIPGIMLHIENKFGKKSAHYKRFMAASVSKLPDEKLLRTTKRVVRIASLHQAEFESAGLTATDINELKLVNDEFETSFENQDDAISGRDIGTMTRIDEANALYELIAKICNTGKVIWKGKNEAKYNDYIIYDPPKGKSEEHVDEVTSEDKGTPGEAS
jgi:hypothetical protein